MDERAAWQAQHREQPSCTCRQPLQQVLLRHIQSPNISENDALSVAWHPSPCLLLTWAAGRSACPFTKVRPISHTMLVLEQKYVVTPLCKQSSHTAGVLANFCTPVVIHRSDPFGGVCLAIMHSSGHEGLELRDEHVACTALNEWHSK